MKSPVWVMQSKKIEDQECGGEFLLLVIYPAFALFLKNYETLMRLFLGQNLCADF